CQDQAHNLARFIPFNQRKRTATLSGALVVFVLDFHQRLLVSDHLHSHMATDRVYKSAKSLRVPDRFARTYRRQHPQESFLRRVLDQVPHAEVPAKFSVNERSEIIYKLLFRLRIAPLQRFEICGVKAKKTERRSCCHDGISSMRSAKPMPVSGPDNEKFWHRSFS